MTDKEMTNLFPDYRQILLPRILSSIDRDSFSPKYGCADRLYWGWKLIDYPDAAHQRLALLLHLIDQEKYVSEINALFHFASTIQHPDGSFDQAFPNEHSHALTAFILCDFTEICLENQPLFAQYRELLVRAGNYLIKHDETHGFISNHLSGAAAGLYKLFLLTQDTRFKDRSSYFLNLVLAHQSEEGWYLEYSGADPSYQSLCMYYLAQLYEMTKNEALFKSLEKSVRFISHFAHPDGSFGGEYGSRNCEIAYPGGLALLAKHIPLAATFLNWCVRAYHDSATVTPLGIDMQNLTPVYANILLADRVLKQYASLKTDEEKLPCNSLDFEREFKAAGIYVRNTKQYYTIVGWRKGGVIKSFDKTTKTICLDDCGALLQKDNRVIGTTQVFSDLHEFERVSNNIKIQSPVFTIKRPFPTPVSFFILRFLNLTLWRIEWIREFGKKLLVEFLMKRCSKLSYSVIREICFESGKPVLKDTLRPENNRYTLLAEKKYSAMHMASSKYFHGKL